MTLTDKASVTQLLTRHQQRFLDTGTAIRNDPPDRIDFLHTIQCQIGLPYKNPGDHVREWDRKQGNASLRIEAGSAIDPKTGEFVKLGLPYGEKPRLVLIHLASEAVRTGKPVVDVENSMTAFSRSLGLETNGQQLKSLKDQLSRLASAYRAAWAWWKREGRCRSTRNLCPRSTCGFPSRKTSAVFWPATVRLSEEYFQSLGKHAVPLDHRAVAVLASSSMALDVYAWLAQRLHRVPPGRPQLITWMALNEQFGQGFARLRDFRRQFLQTLHQVQASYPNARLSATEVGLSLEHSPPPVPPRYNSVLGARRDARVQIRLR